MADKTRSVLGDINPVRGESDEDRADRLRNQDPEPSMTGGSQRDRTEHSGSRDVTEGTTGGTGAEVGGTRNFRQGTGATGTDIGNRPE